jgi:SOS-response transcriptional repressor LexA
MHKIQKKILDLALKGQLNNIGLRQLGRYLHEKYPANVKHHLLQLYSKGLVDISRKSGKLTVAARSTVSKKDSFMNVPILGSANCGEAVDYADECIEGYLRISKNLYKSKRINFAIRAEGNSMNNADIGGATIDDGDYVLIDAQDRQPQKGDYVLSVIDDVANIKKFSRNDQGQVVLLSESNKDLPPIFIDPVDDSNYFVNGKVVGVLKKPRVD